MVGVLYSGGWQDPEGWFSWLLIKCTPVRSRHAYGATRAKWVRPALKLKLSATILAFYVSCHTAASCDAAYNQPARFLKFLCLYTIVKAYTSCLTLWLVETQAHSSATLNNTCTTRVSTSIYILSTHDSSLYSWEFNSTTGVRSCTQRMCVFTFRSS